MSNGRFGKKISGRKRQLVVDTLDLMLAVVVHAANIQDRDGAMLVLQCCRVAGLLIEHLPGWANIVG